MPHSNLSAKNKGKAILLVSLIAITSFLYWWENREPFRVEKTLFRLEDYRLVNKVIFESKSGKIQLSFNGSRWKVNEKYNADRNMIQVLFATLQQAEPRRPVGASEMDSVREELARSGIKVTLFNDEHPEQEFIAGGNASKTRAYFQDPRTGGIFVMNIPGYRVYVSGIMELAENQWRDKLVFAFNWQNFKHLAVEFPGKPAENFSVAMGKNFFELEGIAKSDTAKLNTFLDNVSLLTANEIVGAGRMADSLKSIQPFMVIRAFDTTEKEYSLNVYPESGSTIAGLTQNLEAVLFSRVKLQPIIRPRSFFKTSDETKTR